MSRNRFLSGRTYFEKRNFWRGRIMLGVTVLFNTSIYITVLRLGPEAALGLRRMAAGGPVWLSSVVLEELYAGASTRSRHVVERLERVFHRACRILVPTLTDWTQTGK